MRIPSLLLLLTWLALLPACSGGDMGPPPPDAATEGSDFLPPSDSEGSTNPVLSLPDSVVRVVFLGTSLTEGLGLPLPEVQAWPARIGEMADSAGIAVEVVNAGLSGETSAGALRRVEWILQVPADVLVVETGANDGLRALSTGDLESNLDRLFAHVRGSHPGTEIVLVPMEAPPNLGPDYAEQFREVFLSVAEEWDVTLTSFILDGVAGIPRLNQRDRIHPTADGHRIMARNVWPSLEPLLRRATPPAQLSER